MFETIIKSEFRGPPDCGNGGYVGGTLAAELDCHCASVKLKRPTPLDKLLQVAKTPDGAVKLLDGNIVIAQAEPAEIDVFLPDIPDWQACEKASETGGAGQASPFAYCFACGRLHPNGLQVLTGPVELRKIVAAAWIPKSGFGDVDGYLPDRFVWAALDCPGGFALAHTVSTEQFVTGSISVKINAPIRVGEQYRVLGWHEGVDGRWQIAATALVDETGKPLAVCRSRWLKVN